MEMEIPSFCLDCNVQQENDWFKLPVTSLQKKRQTLKFAFD
jgi:hypothetical protein